MEDSMMPPWQATTMVRPARLVAIRVSVVAAQHLDSGEALAPGRAAR
jgi:hypothetical protein